MPVKSQQDIAALAGVSQATVSRVLNGDPQVNEPLRDRVMQIIRDVNYVPDVRAQMLRNKRTDNLGLVVHRSPRNLSADPFFCSLVAFLIEEAGKRGLHLCIDAARSAHGRRTIYEQMLRTRRVDGLILVEPAEEDERIQRLSREGFPFVLIGRSDLADHVYSVDNDNVGAARQAAEHLLEQGHRRVGFIGGPPGLLLHEDRLKGYSEALLAADLAVDQSLLANADFTEAGGAKAMKRLLEQREPPTSVLCLDDLIAMGALRAAKDSGRSVPQDLAIVGFNDSAICPYLHPPLTSVAVDIASLARHATQLLVDLINGRVPEEPRRIVASRLVARESSMLYRNGANPNRTDA